MRISGTEPSSVILSQTKYFQKLKTYAPKVSKQAEAKRDGVINPLNYNFFKHLKWSIEVCFWPSVETPVDKRQHFCFDKIMW